MSLPRVHLVHGPTPIARYEALDGIVGAEVWVKHDDATAGAAAGNKLRKLELLFADARARGAELVVTCGGLQSNHARATALTAARLGLAAILLLRVPDPERAHLAPLPTSGNVLLDRMAGAHIRFVSPEEYRERGALLERVRLECEERGVRSYVIPEGGSNGLGAHGYVEAMRETRRQMDLGLAGDGIFDVIAHACGSGGTAAGVALGARAFDVARATWAFAVCDDRAYFERVIAQIALEARGLDPSLPELAGLVVDDAAKGPAYGTMSEEQLAFLVRVASETGLVLDPVYTGKALFGLAQAVARGDIAKGARVLFVHTGGLPGLLAQGAELAPALAAAKR
ncbi:MAG: putative pyridoxal phosphate-dependent deaminase [Labilithrix sp.]|nr:putative pyridoxal phosphate-dependent deaminase [Labilithrix sp.]